MKGKERGLKKGEGGNHQGGGRRLLFLKRGRNGKEGRGEGGKTELDRPKYGNTIRDLCTGGGKLKTIRGERRE